MTTKEKIIACYGKVTPKSIAKMCNTSYSYVGNVIAEFCTNTVRVKKKKK